MSEDIDHLIFIEVDTRDFKCYYSTIIFSDMNNLDYDKILLKLDETPKIVPNDKVISFISELKRNQTGLILRSSYPGLAFWEAKYLNFIRISSEGFLLFDRNLKVIQDPFEFIKTVSW